MIQEEARVHHPIPAGCQPEVTARPPPWHAHLQHAEGIHKNQDLCLGWHRCGCAAEVDVALLRQGEALKLNALPSLPGSVMPQDGSGTELIPELLATGDSNQAQPLLLVSADSGASSRIQNPNPQP
jgi:hypothetical protein